MRLNENYTFEGAADKDLASVHCAFCLQNVPLRGSKVSVGEGRRGRPRKNNSEKSANMLDETVQLGCGSVIAGCSRNPPRSITAREGRWIRLMAAMDHSATS
ncbi:hypothetical protein TNCV_337901 [Trichonephila clavipes]|nr:hypothetical protein TNCV_337901 [Trichonephila clavipes]